MIKNRPLRHHSHRKEDKSKRAFEEIIDPFFVTAWTQRDYGIDSIIEITSNNGSVNDVELDSKCFLAQLKATERIKITGDTISYPVEVKKVLYWYNYNLPVLFVLHDCKENCFYHRWMDDILIAQLDAEKPNWSNQKSISIKIERDSILNEKSLNDIKSYVKKWKMPVRRKISPGKYFELRGQSYVLINEYKDLTQKFNFASINDAIRDFELDIDQSIYRVAITGLSRVGKSSLINALLNKEVSPTGFYQTTGVPIQVIPGSENTLNIYFHDNTSLNFPFSLDHIEQYASQDYNEDNRKGVKLVSISIKNELLERGVSLFDIPGLDDPDDQILEYTWQTVRKVNAIIYVIDASPAEDGGYIFKNDYKKHITTFSQSQDKVFLVFNKVDRLSDNTIAKLKERVIQDLKKHNLIDSIGDRIFYLSAEKEDKSRDVSTINDLNESLWGFILNENKFGITKLNMLNQEIAKCSQYFEEILQARLIDSTKRIELDKLITIVRAKMPNLTSNFGERLSASKSTLFNSLENKKHSAIDSLEKVLLSTHKDKNLPGSIEVRKYLTDSLNQAMEQLNNEYALQVNQLKIFIDEWIEENLRQVREILSDKQNNKIINFTEIETFELPQVDISSAWGMGLLGVVAGIFVAPFAAIAGGLIGFFGNLFISAESIRAKQISKIMQKSKDRYNSAFSKLKVAYGELIHEQVSYLNKYVQRKLNFFFDDLNSQMAQIDNPLSTEEIEKSQEVFKQVQNFQKRLNEFDVELRSYQFTK